MLQSQNNPVSFITCCYEGDWEYFLKKGRLKEMINRCNYPFAKKILIINNVSNRQLVNQYASAALQENVIDTFFFSEDIIRDVLRKFSLRRKDFRLDGYDGYWYSVAPLTAAYICTTTYLLYFTGDCMLRDKYQFNWIDEGISKLQNSNVFCVTPLWDYYNAQAHKFTSEDASCYFDDGFSDQAFLMKAKHLASVNFNEYHVSSEVFPIYGGNHFERRIYCYMHNRQLQRCVLKDVVYTHEKLLKPGYKPKKSIVDEIKYIIAKCKKVLRRKNIMVKYLLR